MVTILGVSNPRRVPGGVLIDVTLATKEYGTVDCTLGPNDGTVYVLTQETGGIEVTNSGLHAIVTGGHFGPVTEPEP